MYSPAPRHRRMAVVRCRSDGGVRPGSARDSRRAFRNCGRTGTTRVFRCDHRLGAPTRHHQRMDRWAIRRQTGTASSRGGQAIRFLSSRFHADRAAGGHRHHRRPDRPAAARRPGRPRGGAADPVHQQPKQIGLALHNYHDVHDMIAPGRIWMQGLRVQPGFYLPNCPPTHPG